MTYTVIDISKYQKYDFEPLGTKSKFWVKNDENIDILFKSIEATDKEGTKIYRTGENWAEKIACELAKKINIPSAEYDLATYDGTHGVITQSFIPDADSYLISGNELLTNYSIQEYSDPNKETQDLFAVYLILKRIIKGKPIGHNSLPNIKTAADFFSGYLMLDALISNQDRHSENWGYIVTKKGTTHLAPSFDHASSLGRNESHENKVERMGSKDTGRMVNTYVKKSKSYFYANKTRLKTLDAFEYYGVLRPQATLQWIAILESLDNQEISEIVIKIPENIMDQTSKQFAIQMIECNKINIISKKEIIRECLGNVHRKSEIKRRRNG
jgi:hypothetical protein